jgi:hypothetical protein
MLSQGSSEHGFSFICIGDRKGPLQLNLPHCEYFNFRSQLELGFRFANICPADHYARKNIGYLIAMREGATWIIDTDDDNEPKQAFWEERNLRVRGRYIQADGWVNAYSYFGGNSRIWPRGLPLDAIKSSLPEAAVHDGELTCPIQQGLADGDPDVDAVYRLTGTLPFFFEMAKPLTLSPQAWCPFNSQNTSWSHKAFPLLYLPSHCSFRMTDIWRSMIAQACMWQNGWHLSFHAPTVIQHRNTHNLMKDFADEVPGYLNNQRCMETLANLDLKPGLENIPDNMRKCYQAFISIGIISAKEMELLNAWFLDLKDLNII